jgi:hypothetical protein
MLLNLICYKILYNTFYRRHIVEISLELTVKRKNYNEKCLSQKMRLLDIQMSNSLIFDVKGGQAFFVVIFSFYSQFQRNFNYMTSVESVVQNFTKIRRRVLYFCYTDIGVKVVKCYARRALKITSKNKKIYPKMLVPKNVQYCTLNCERRQISKCFDVMKKKYLTDL